jgi:hypothetical protein
VFGLVPKGVNCKDGWCKIYDDKDHKRFNEDVIEIKVDAVKMFSVLAINLPKRRSPLPDGDYVYLTLCEVKIYAGIKLVFKCFVL